MARKARGTGGADFADDAGAVTAAEPFLLRISRRPADKALARLPAVSTIPPGTHASLFTESHWLSRKRSGGGMADTYV